MIRERIIGGRKTNSFTLQWHLTNACEEHCVHCYDRRNLSILDTDECLRILSDFQDFCKHHRVYGQVCLTGGNPLLHPGFWRIYQAVVDAKIKVSILGNPIDKATIQKLLDIRCPIYYQISMEGLQNTNDAIRGKGHYDRALQFLKDAKEMRLPAHVMLTLSRMNIPDVIPLAKQLDDLAVQFRFNRLSQVGEAKDIDIPHPKDYEAFLKEYMEAARSHLVMGMKDNLFNVIRHREQRSSFGGCTGFGCGAAFNFVALLPNGEVHACRKFPSPIGDIRNSSLSAIYYSKVASQYRSGPKACRGCAVKKQCRGCMAVIYGHGGDPFTALDPHCFFKCKSLD